MNKHRTTYLHASMHVFKTHGICHACASLYLHTTLYVSHAGIMMTRCAERRIRK